MYNTGPIQPIRFGLYIMRVRITNQVLSLRFKFLNTSWTCTWNSVWCHAFWKRAFCGQTVIESSAGTCRLTAFGWTNFEPILFATGWTSCDLLNYLWMSSPNHELVLELCPVRLPRARGSRDGQSLLVPILVPIVVSLQLLGLVHNADPRPTLAGE